MQRLYSMSWSRILRSVVTAILCLAGAAYVSAQIDDFNDGFDENWNRYDPLLAHGAPGAFNFPNGGYQLQSAGSPNPGTFGPGRVASVRLDRIYSNFSISIDVVDWNSSLDQVFGILSRIKEVGPGTSDGYIFLCRPLKNDFIIERIDNESGIPIASGLLQLDHDKDYRFTFAGQGSQLTGLVFDLADTANPLLSFSASDSAYTSGLNGLLVSTNAPGGYGAGDATFDNYSATVPEPSITALAFAALFLINCGRLRRISHRNPA